MDPEIERYYRVLNLPATATPEQVYKAYRDLARVWDPSRFATQPHLEHMAEGKLKEIVEAYNAISRQAGTAPAAPPVPAPPETPELLTPVPDHIVDRNLQTPVFSPAAPIAPEFGKPVEDEPAAEPLPLQPWEEPRPPSYPKPEAGPATPEIQFAPPPPPLPRGLRVYRFLVRFGAFAVPAVLIGLGFYLFYSAPERPERPDLLPSAAPGSGTAPAKSPTPGAGGAAGEHHPGPKAAEAQGAKAIPLQLPNGAQLMPPRGMRGVGRFKIANHSGQDAVVRVALQSAPTSPLRLVYVQPDTEVPIEGIGTGVYVVSISLGAVTGGPRKFAPPLGPFQFMQVESVDGPQSDEYQIVLKPNQ